MRALDYTKPSGINWIGNANELCAGYAADAYARAWTQVARKSTALNQDSRSAMVGALFTTYGVGELSAINAVAGSYAESVPLISLVSTPSRKAMLGSSSRRPIHHSLADGNMGVYAEMFKYITCAQAILHDSKDARDAAELYDKTLEKAVLISKPVYVSLSSDMVEQQVSADMLDQPLNVAPPPNDPQVEEAIISYLLRKISVSERPLIIADGLSYSCHLEPEINDLIALTGIPAMSFTSGKGVVDESSPYWSPMLPNTTDFSRTTDLVLLLGPLLSDTNTARWSAIPNVDETVMFNLDSVEVAGKTYEGVRSKHLLRALVSRISKERTIQQKKLWSQEQSSAAAPPQIPHSRGRITQDDFWPKMSSFVRPDDSVLLANGTPLIGGRYIRLSSGCQVIASGIWCSIGQMLPAAQGVAAAKRDHSLPGRTILFEGDGSFQVTCQSISDIIRNKLEVTMFIVNNAGYTYERWLNGMEAEYNDVPAWRYTDAPKFFGAETGSAEYPILTRIVNTWGELQEVLADELLGDGKGLKIIDVVMDPQDVPKNSKPGLVRASEALRSA